MPKKVVIFCSREYKTEYQKLAYNLGKTLADNGYITVTGGGPGLMEYVNQGAFENNGQSWGIRLNKSPKKTKKYLTKLQVLDNFDQTNQTLINSGDAFIALPGGLGTIEESLKIILKKFTKEIKTNVPLIFLGDYYKKFIDSINEMAQKGFIKNCNNLYCFAKDEKQAIRIIKNKI